MKEKTAQEMRVKNNTSGADKGKVACKSVEMRKMGGRCQEQDKVIKQVL